MEHRKGGLREKTEDYRMFSCIDALDSGGTKRGWLAPPPHQSMTKNSILIRLFFIVHTPDKVLIDLKIVTDDAIVEVYVPRAERILFMLG